MPQSCGKKGHSRASRCPRKMTTATGRYPGGGRQGRGGVREKGEEAVKGLGVMSGGLRGGLLGVGRGKCEEGHRRVSGWCLTAGTAGTMRWEGSSLGRRLACRAMKLQKEELEAGEVGVDWTWAPAGKGAWGGVKWGVNGAQVEVELSKWVCGDARAVSATPLPRATNASPAAIAGLPIQLVCKSCGGETSCQSMFSRLWRCRKEAWDTRQLTISREVKRTLAALKDKEREEPSDADRKELARFPLGKLEKERAIWKGEFVAGRPGRALGGL